MSGPGRDRDAGAQHRPAPHAREEEDVGQQHRVEAQREEEDAALATANERTRSSPSSITGAGWRAERATNAASASAEATSEPTTGALPQPQSWPLTIPSDSRPTPATSSTMPRMSVSGPGIRLAALAQQPPRGDQRRQADGEVDEEDPAPARRRRRGRRRGRVRWPPRCRRWRPRARSPSRAARAGTRAAAAPARSGPGSRRPRPARRARRRAPRPTAPARTRRRRPGRSRRRRRTSAAGRGGPRAGPPARAGRRRRCCRR